MAKRESWHQPLPLMAMIITLCEQDTDTEQTGQSGVDIGGLLVVVRVCDKHFGEGFGGGDEEPFGVEDS